MKISKDLFETLNTRVLSILVAVAGCINLLSAVYPGMRERLFLISDYIPLELSQTARFITALSGFFLLTLALNLWRRKRTAWLVAIIILLFAGFLHLVKGLDYEEASFSCLIALWLGLSHKHFYASSDRPTIHEGIKITIIALIFNLTYAFLGFVILSRHFLPHPNLTISAKNALNVVFLQSPSFAAIGKSSRFFLNSTYLISVITGFYAFFKLFEPIFLAQNTPEAEKNKVEEIISKFGQTAISKFSLLPDKHYFFFSQSAICYQIYRGVALVLGDPVGPKNNFSQIINEFKKLCAKNSWEPVFYQTLPDNLKSYTLNSFSHFQIGCEAIVNLEKFNLDGPENKKIRNAYNKIGKLNFKTIIYSQPLSEIQIDELKKISDEWLSQKGHNENRFSSGWFLEQYIKNTSVIVAFSDDKPCAFINFYEYGDRKIAIDLMRHNQFIENSLMEYLFVKLFYDAKKNHYKVCNLGLSPLADYDNINRPIIRTTLKFIYENITQFYNFKGLHAFKDKFNPDWQPRYLVYPRHANLLNIAWAIAQAHTTKIITQKEVE